MDFRPRTYAFARRGVERKNIRKEHLHRAGIQGAAKSAFPIGWKVRSRISSRDVEGAQNDQRGEQYYKNLRTLRLHNCLPINLSRDVFET